MTLRDRLIPSQGGVRQMRIIATGLLVAMAGLFLLARTFEPTHPAWGYVRAFAEAAMVGGLADWFAVTALFRHPLGLPIPHTAIIPRNKDRIGDSLASFLRSNFLVPRIVARRMAKLDVARAIGRVLASPPREGAMRAGAGNLAETLLESLGDERLGQLFKSAAAQRLKALDVAPLAGKLMATAMDEERHRPMINAAILWAGRTLDANEPLFRQMIHERAGSILRWTGLDETLSTKILDGLFRLLGDMAEDRNHPLRIRAEEALAGLAQRLQTDPELQARVAAFRDAALANPAVGEWLDGLWQNARAAMLRAARDPEAVAAGKFGEAMRQMGTSLQEDPRVRFAVNRFARRATAALVASYGDGIVTLVSETVRSWDAHTVTGRLENAVGRDLQYIRINGTLVGGLVGVVIHIIDTLA
ncbi:MAG TPA: DUF445 domain-containing protein [Sphingomonas sp.]|uniref:DUF445 domain-containing protein n=1 Tax=Sphingomonas sp. TaxID=28214 RepID=UPI002BAF5FCC|nr:DUF445 domain-containing protein [Sphingomonas sp.]HMI18799.1 DUF445 domain-containing protein [Sphingomonas sp.]